MNHPALIETAQLELADIEEQLKIERTRCRAIELDKALDALNAKDDKGKPVLTNDKMRDAAVGKLLEEDDAYRDVARNIGQLERQKLVGIAKLERLRMEFRVEMLEAEQRNALACLKVADAIYAARHDNHVPMAVQEEVTLPF
jgi:hypothetical protein